jgi:hypothetical protein
MRPLLDAEIRDDLREYYREWIRARSGQQPRVSLQLLVAQDFASRHENFFRGGDADRIVKAAGELRFADLSPEIAKAAGIAGPVSLWAVDASGYPRSRIDEDEVIQTRFPAEPRRLFVADCAGPGVPLFFAWYDGSVSSLPFLVLDPAGGLRDVAFYVRGRLGVAMREPLDAYHVGPGLRPAQVSTEVPLSSLGIEGGLIVFQRAHPPPREAAPVGDAKVYRIFDLLPEFACPGFPAFCDGVRAVVSLAFSAIGETREFALVAPAAVRACDVLRALRAIIGNADDGILALARDIVDLEQERPYLKVVPGKFLSFQVMPGTRQAELARKVAFKLPVYDAALANCHWSLLLMPENFTAGDVVRKLEGRAQGPWRVVELNGSRILRIVDPDTNLYAIRTRAFRAEIVPEDQRGVQEAELVRVMLTTDSKAPGSAPVGQPFFFRIIRDEPFAQTKARLAVFAKVDEKTKFAYTNECQAFKDFKLLEDNDVLSGLLCGKSRMLYIFVVGQPKIERKRLNTDASLKIYN